MTLTINLLNPTNGARQVASDESLEVEFVTSSFLRKEITTLFLNGKSAFKEGTIFSPTNLIESFSNLGSTSFLLEGSFEFQLNEKVDLLSLDGIYTDKIKTLSKDGYSLSLENLYTTTELRTLKTDLVQQINEKTIKTNHSSELDPTTLGFQPIIKIINESGSVELLRKVVEVSGDNLVLDLGFSFPDATSVVFQPQLRSRKYGFEGEFVGNNLTLIPLEGLQQNKVYFLTVETANQEGDQKRSVFSFRTQDKKPPQILDLRSIIQDSEIDFKLVDLLDNEIIEERLNVWLNEEQAILNGQVQDNFTGEVTKITNSLLEIFLRPHKRFGNDEEVSLRLEVQDGYGNLGREIKFFKNKTAPLFLELVEITPREDSILDPSVHPITLRLRSSVNLTRRLINISYRVNEVARDEIVRGEFVTVCTVCQDQVNEIGEVRVSSSEIYILLSNIRGVLFNSSVALDLLLQESDENGELVGEPIFQKTFHFSTTSSIFGPILDRFVPDLTKPVSRSTKVGFRALSLTKDSPVDRDSLTVSINNQLAIDEGNFVNEYGGLIKVAQNSNGNSLLVEIVPPSFFEVGALVPVVVTISDLAGNLTTRTYNLPIVNTQAPILTFTPPPGVYTKIQRITLRSNQPAQIYYTIDGSVPQIGQLGAFVGSDVIPDLPVFIDGITQIKAFAVNSSGSTSALTTGLYDLNTTKPEIEILSPANETMVEEGFAKVSYKITLKRGYLTRLEWRLNRGIRVDLQNTTLESSCFILGPTSGDNLVEFFATDNYGNVGTKTLNLRVPSSSLEGFKIKFAPLKCPVFSRRVFRKGNTLSSILDVETIAILGDGKRSELLVNFALGDGKDGEPGQFQAGMAKDGRHFRLKSFPLLSLDLFLTRKGSKRLIKPDDYVLNEATGEVVLDHPLEVGESLEANYISQSDLEDPSLFLELDGILEKHGPPLKENSLSLAAQLAFENGARRILAIQPRPDDYGWFQAFKRLETEECYYILPIFEESRLDKSLIVQNAYQHTLKMSNIKYRKERVLTLPFENDLPKNPRLRTLELDNNSKITKVLNGELQTLDRVFANASFLGKEASILTAGTMTRKTISGFVFSIKKKSPRLDLESRVVEGVTTIVPLLDGGQVFQARTSSEPGSAILEEPSVQRIQDYISKFLRQTLENQFIGQPITKDLLKEMERTGNAFLERSKDLISTGQVTRVVQRTDEPRQVDLQVVYSPLFPLNQITITFNLTTSF